MKRFLTSLLVSLFLMVPAVSSATVSGEVFQKKPQNITQSPQYMKDKRGMCYTMVKGKKTGKLVKKYVDKKLCIKK
ncbi:hypothetical protein KBB25_02270 [Candidatus Gracilibacteria bacterium]|nr:hypothetical protein [Candidatus Gracilibacteria bacterium]